MPRLPEGLRTVAADVGSSGNDVKANCAVLGNGGGDL